MSKAEVRKFRFVSETAVFVHKNSLLIFFNWMDLQGSSSFNKSRKIQEYLQAIH